MYIARTMQFLPYVSLAVLVAALLFLEVKAWREQSTEEPEPEPGRAGFINPPGGEGYEYYVNGTNIVYILRKAKRRFRVYLAKTTTSPSAKVKRDRWGQYFTVRCNDAAACEHIVDAAFGM
ncbi:MAG: hypothetical protein LUH42_02900 [Oscillospiraceae bacterium]|nr:hypothetical protein [Oscillospiraceae bacterium]